MNDRVNAKVRDHDVHVYWCDWSRQWRAYSESLGGDCSPYGEGTSKAAALTDLEWQLDEMDQRRATRHESK